MQSFSKYQGAGNDFVLIDARKELPFALNDQHLIERLCDRHFGIGADGLMLLREHADFDFEMVYFNSDGYPSSMCGNGGRCIVAYAKKLGIIDQQTRFLAVDGPHEAEVIADGQVALGMSEVQEIERAGNDFILDTGSPHYVRFQDDVATAPLVETARQIRYSDRFNAAGINVNLVENTAPGQLCIRTYERGVENETLACGTGITAAAISQAVRDGIPGRERSFSYRIMARGGQLKVSGRWMGGRFGELLLTGPASFVFSGQIALD